MALTGGRDDGRPMMDINTTPLIDVLLVLLIMFIISLPRPTHKVEVDLPAPDRLIVPEQVKNKLAITAAGTITWNGTPIDLLTLRNYLNQTVTMVPEPELQFRPDSEARYARVDETLAVIKHAGVRKLGFVGNEQYFDRF